jgi:hypothetical protein
MIEKLFPVLHRYTECNFKVVTVNLSNGTPWKDGGVAVYKYRV